MAESSKSKHINFALDEEKSEKADRISSLPDELICHILSFLQTRDAIGTSVLSTRWRSLWTKVCAIDINDNWHFLGRKTFSSVMGKVLAQRKTKCVKRLRISSGNKRCQPQFISTLVADAVSQKMLEELDLAISHNVEARLPATLFICQTITVMKLGWTLNLDIPSHVHLPLLKVLHLYLLHFVDDDSIMRLLSGCPVLEELSYEELMFKRSESFIIRVPSLKKLHVKSNDTRLQLHTPSLKYLHLQETKATTYLVGNMANLVQAHIDICFVMGEMQNLSNLFSGICGTKFLCLSASTNKVLVDNNIQLPEFQNLDHLQLYLNTFDDSFSLVNQILEKCPNLDALDIEKVNDETRWPQQEMNPQQEMAIARTGNVLKTTIVQIANLLKPQKIIRSVMSKLSCSTMSFKRLLD